AMTLFDTPFPVPLPASKPVTVDFAGGDLSSDAGLIPLSLADQRLGLTAALADAIADPRDPRRIDHSMHDLLRQRIYMIAQGYADANDANALRHDPLLKLVVGRTPADAPLAGQSTLSRLENTVTQADVKGLARVLLDQFLARCGTAPQQIVLDLDPYADPCHGSQQLSLFSGHYDTYCLLPLYLCGSIDGSRPYVIGALLRHGRSSPVKGARLVLQEVVQALRERFPAVKILVRGDGGFGVPKMIRLCRRLEVNFLFGKPQNTRLHAHSEREQLQAAVAYSVMKRSHRVFGEFRYQAKSWQQAERMIVKAEVTQGKLNPRFVVTDLLAEDGWTPQAVYGLYCERGDAPENRIKEFKVDLAADRLSCHTAVANQFRLLLHVAAYILIQTLQDGLASTGLAGAQAGTLRVLLLKVAARVMERVRGVRVQLPTSFPLQREWRRLVAWLQCAPPRPPDIPWAVG
ncbi:MAG: IS1380 family transposase, partial [Acidimicrobiia bacterium]